jgi:hypothetical protein
MEFSEFSEILGRWWRQRPDVALDCWIDDANVRLTALPEGVRCSIEVLDPYDALDPPRLDGLLGEAGASLACGCEGALAIDPVSGSVVLVSWLPNPCSVEQGIGLLERLANQRAAMLGLLSASLLQQASGAASGGTLNNRFAGE